METALIMQIASFAIKYGPEAVESISKAFKKDTITADDWNEQADKWLAKSAQDYLDEAEKDR